MNKKILYKLLLIFVLFLIVSSSSVFAATQNIDSITVPVDTNEIVITNPFILEYENILVLRWYQSSVGVYQFRVFFSNEGAFGFYYKNNKEFAVTCVNENLEHVPFYYISAAYNNIKTSESTFNNCTLDDVTCYQKRCREDNLYSSIDNIAYAKYDVLTYDYSNSVVSSDVLLSSTTGNGSFFQLPPQVQEQVTTLAPIVEEVEAKKTLAEVVGILPLIIVVVVSLVGLRKALKMLLAVLHRA